MGMKKIRRLIGQEISKAYNNGWNKGWNVGWDTALENAEGKLFEDGVRAEKDRVQQLLKMLSENELQVGSGTKAKMYRDVAELLAFEYNEEEARLQYEREDDF